MQCSRILAPSLSLLLVAAALTYSATGSAHSVVLATSPPRNGVVAVAPTQVTTTWNEKVTEVQESVTGPDNAQWSTGAIHGSGAEYSVALPPSPPSGTYTVNW